MQSRKITASLKNLTLHHL